MLVWQLWQGDPFRLVDRLRYPAEVWGLTADDNGRLIVSDGSSRLLVLDPGSMRLMDRIDVTAGLAPVDSINELEWVKGEVWANVLPTNRIVRIDPASGLVLGILELVPPTPDLGGPWSPANGIAYDPDTGDVAFAGKKWPVTIINRLDSICAHAAPGPACAGGNEGFSSLLSGRA
jgi:glutaminyl-peptide cyclotransferase